MSFSRKIRRRELRARAARWRPKDPYVHKYKAETGPRLTAEDFPGGVYSVRMPDGTEKQIPVLKSEVR